MKDDNNDDDDNDADDDGDANDDANAHDGDEEDDDEVETKIDPIIAFTCPACSVLTLGN